MDTDPDVRATLDIDLVALDRTDTVDVLLELTAPMQRAEARRQRQAVQVVLDTGMAMSQDHLDAALSAVSALVRRLRDKDLFGLVTFADDSRLVVPFAPIATLRRDRISTALGNVARRDGASDLHSGYLRALEQIRRARKQQVTVLVLCAGSPENPRPVVSEMARAVATRGVTTSTIGIGHKYDAHLVSGLARDGSGDHVFAPDPIDIREAVLGQVDRLLKKSLQATQLIVMNTGAVDECSVVTDLPVTRREDELYIDLGDFYGGEKRSVLLSFTRRDPTQRQPVRLAELEVSYVSLPDKEARITTMPVMANAFADDAPQGQRVETHYLLHKAQLAKRDVARDLRQCWREDVRHRLEEAREALRKERQDDLQEEVEAIDTALDGSDDEEWLLRWLHADSDMKARGRMTGAAVGNRCPDCHAELVPIVYGLPDEDLGKAAERGEIVLGGCDPRGPSIGCPACTKAQREAWRFGGSQELLERDRRIREVMQRFDLTRHEAESVVDQEQP